MRRVIETSVEISTRLADISTFVITKREAFFAGRAQKMQNCLAATGKKDSALLTTLKYQHIAACGRRAPELLTWRSILCNARGKE
jgi:hypothetical protein